MRVSATYKCDNCGLEEFVEGKGLPRGWGASRWTEPFVLPSKPVERPPNGTVTHVCSGNCRRAHELRCLGEVVTPEPG